MSLNVKDVLQAPILRYDILDSTNNRAAQMIDADTAQPGLTIITQQQTAGKGQRGNVWHDEPAQSLLMSIVLQPKVSIDEQFSFSAMVAVAVAELIQELDSSLKVNIKFPNDLIINDKKAAGILIENSLRGNLWTHAIVGFGLNVHQKQFDGQLPNATSLFAETQKPWSIETLMHLIREKIIVYTMKGNPAAMLAAYNELLYKKSQEQSFTDMEGTSFDAIILAVNDKGELLLQHRDGQVRKYVHGLLNWVWKKTL